MTETPDWVQDAMRDCPPFLTAAEAMSLFRWSRSTLFREIKSGRLQPVRLAAGAGTSRLSFPRAEIARYLVACAERRAGTR